MQEFPDFAVACGEEASDPVVLADGSPVQVDQLAASSHLERQSQDLADVASLGVRVLFDMDRNARPVAASFAALARERS